MTWEAHSKTSLDTAGYHSRQLTAGRTIGLGNERRPSFGGRDLESAGAMADKHEENAKALHQSSLYLNIEKDRSFGQVELIISRYGAKSKGQRLFSLRQICGRTVT